MIWVREPDSVSVASSTPTAETCPIQRFLDRHTPFDPVPRSGSTTTTTSPQGSEKVNQLQLFDDEIMAASVTASAMANNDWYLRMQKRRDAELSILRRPSKTGSQTSSEQQTTITSPASPKSSHSTVSSSTVTSCSIRSLDIQALQQQLAVNSAQIEANEARMAELRDFDDRMGESISDRLSFVRDINESLRTLHEMLARTEKITKELGLDKKKSR